MNVSCYKGSCLIIIYVSQDGWTALLLAVSQGHRDIAEYLIREGANIHIRDDVSNPTRYIYIHIYTYITIEIQ